MLCQNCQQNEATKSFVTNWMGAQYKMHVCDECYEQMYPRQTGESPFPEDAQQALKFRLQLNKLRYRLEEAVKRENYEEAARLRDSIAKIQQEEISHEC